MACMENMQPVEEEMSECLLDSDDEDVYPSSQDENYARISPKIKSMTCFS